MVSLFHALDMRADRGMFLGQEFGEKVLLLRRADDEDGAGVGDRLRHILEERLVLLDPLAVPGLAGVKIADHVVADDRPVRLLNIEMENSRALVIDPDDGVIMVGHQGPPAGIGGSPYRGATRRAMTRFMRENVMVGTMAAAPPDKAATYEISEDEAGMRLDRWLRRRFPGVSNSHLMRIVRKGEVRVSGKRADVSTRLEAGEIVRVPPLKLAAEQGRAVSQAGPGDLEAIRAMTLFEDRDVLVLNKPHGLAVQGGSGTKRHIDGMLEALADREGNRPVLVHRLDRDTSGVLLIAKSRKTAAELGEIFRSRRAKKIYWALVEGVPKPSQGRISMFLAKGDGMGDARGQGRADLERMRVASHGDPDAQHSLTLYAVVDKVAPRLAWLSMRPFTGRTHQLRAHCEAIGHPIVGDPKYNRKPANDPARRDPLRALPPGLDPRLHLLARRLILPHPRGGLIDVTAPLPEHMSRGFAMFGFDETERDPIEDAPDE